jgi:hypothetical protein
MAATTEVSSLAEAREAAFDAAADLRALGRAHEAALARIRALEQESRVRRPALDAALVKLVAGAEWELEALLAKNVRVMILGELPVHVADELRSRAGDIARLEVLRRAAAALPDSAFHPLEEFTLELRAKAARAAQRTLVDEVMASYRLVEVITGLLGSLERLEAKQPGMVYDPMLMREVQQHVGPHEREVFEAARHAEMQSLEPLLRDATAPAVDAAERVRSAVAKVDAALRGEFEPEPS